MATVVTVTYGEGGYDTDKPNDNALLVTEQDTDDGGFPIGDPRETFRAFGYTGD